MFTDGDEAADVASACKHLISGGLWVRQIKEAGMKKAFIYCLDKTVMNEFVEPFGLTNIKVDVPLEIGDYFMSVVLIKCWGKKLDDILDWKQQVEAHSGSATVSPSETGLRGQSSGESTEGVQGAGHQDTDDDVRADHREDEERFGEEVRSREEK